MILPWLRKRRHTLHRPVTFRPVLEALDHRIVPANAHFVSASSSVDPMTGVLTVNFHEAGLGNNTQVNVTLTGDAHATYQWFNNGSNKPQGQPFNVDQTFSLTGTFSSDKNGEVRGTFTVSPPGLDAFLATHHAANWTPVLSVSYTNVVVTDVTNNTSTLDAGIFLDQTTTVIHL
jgi:hypothetical protein